MLSYVHRTQGHPAVHPQTKLCSVNGNAGQLHCTNFAAPSLLSGSILYTFPLGNRSEYKLCSGQMS